MQSENIMSFPFYVFLVPVLQCSLLNHVFFQISLSVLDLNFSTSTSKLRNHTSCKCFSRGDLTFGDVKICE